LNGTFLHLYSKQIVTDRRFEGLHLQKGFFMTLRYPLKALALLTFVFLVSFGLMMGSSSSAHAATSPATTTHQSSMTLARPMQTLSPNDVSVYIWATNVNVHWGEGGQCLTYPSESCAVVGQFSQQYVSDECQATGQSVTYDGITNNWWSRVLVNGQAGYGWVSNIFIRGGETIAGVPKCYASE
jgi:hypothetical protein